MQQFRSCTPLLLASVILIAVIGFAAFQPIEAIAFNHSWSYVSVYSNNVSSHGLWDDIAAGSAPNTIPVPKNVEAALMWFKNAKGQQQLTYHTIPSPINAATYPTVTVRAAVSDIGSLQVFIYEPLGDNHICDAGTGAQTILTWSASEADGYYKTKSATLPHAAPVEEICIKLYKSTNSETRGRTSVLIDDISIHDSAGHVGWEEKFTGNP